MTEEEYEKKVKWNKIFCILIGVINLIAFMGGISEGKIIESVLCVGNIVGLFLFYYFVKKKKMAGPIIGIIIGIIYIGKLSLLTIIMGIFIILDCLEIIRYIRGNNEKSKISGKKIVIFVIIIVAVCVLIYIGFFGIIIMNEGIKFSENTVNNPSNNNQVNINASNSNNNYYSNGITVKYGKDWTEDNIEAEGEAYRSLINESEGIIFTVSELQDIQFDDYTQESNRQTLYDGLRILYQNAYYGRNLINESRSFKFINNNLYCACFELDGSLYSRFYILLNTQKSKACCCITMAGNTLTKEQEGKVMDLIQTVEF